MGTFVFPQRRPGFTDRYPQKPGSSFLPSPQQAIGPVAAAMLPQGKPLNATTTPLQRIQQRPKTIPPMGAPMTQPLRHGPVAPDRDIFMPQNATAQWNPIDREFAPAATSTRLTPPSQQGGMPPVVAPIRQQLPMSATMNRASRGIATGQPDLLAASLKRTTATAPAVAQSQPPQAPPNYDTPYYKARQVRNLLGKGSPHIAGGEQMTAAQRQQGYAQMANPATATPEAPTARSATQFVSRQAGFPQQPSQNPLTEPMGNPIAAMRRSTGQGLQSLTNPTEFAKYTAAGGTKPLMVYSGSGREGPLNKLPMARNREEMNARQNRLGEGGMTFDQAVADRANFNKDGRFFQGAKLSEQNGRPVFVSDEKPTFAGGAVNEADAAGGRIAALMRMQKQGKGYVTPDNKFVGMAGAGGGEAGAANASLLRDVPNALARRIPQGVEIGNSPTSEQMQANKAGMLARLQARKDKAGQIRTERAQAMELARRNAPSPQMQAMLNANPELALRFMEAQQRGQALQAQLGNQQAALALEGRKVDQEGQIARAGLEFKASDSKAEREAKAAGQAELIAAEQKKQADMIAAQQAQQQGNLQFQSKEGEANRANAKDVAGIQAKAAADRIAADERAKKDAADAALTKAVMDDPNMTLEQKQQMLADRQQQAAGSSPAGVAGVGGALPRTATGLASGKTFAGNTLTKSQFLEAQKVDDANELASLLRSYNLSDDQVTVALNELKPPNFAANVAQGPFGIARLMQGKTWAPRHRSADDPGGFGNMLRDRFIDPKTGKTKTTFFGRMLGVRED